MVVNGMTKSLFASQAALCCLHGYVPQQELYLFQFAACCVTEPGARPSQIVRRALRNLQFLGVHLDHVPKTFSVIPSPHTVSERQTQRNNLPVVISAAVNHSSKNCFTQFGTGTVRTWPPFPTRSTMFQRSSRR